jgi:hypothetical protein
MPDLVLDRRFIERVLSCNNVRVVQPVESGREGWRNELLLFLKPEIFLAEQVGQIEASLRTVSEKLQEFDAHIGGVVIVSGRVLDQLDIMSRHYGFINKLSNSASKMLDVNEYQRIADALQMSSTDGFEILGGHEYLARYPDEDCFDLDRLWFSKRSVKLRSGFYVQSYEIGEAKIILVNGFHPVQLAHFTDPTHRIVLVLIHSNTDWAVLRNEMVGATFPERATQESIRGTLYACPQRFGFRTVSIANNGVHLSAGPFEALFEIINFGRAFGLDIEKTPPLVMRRLLEAGLETEQASSVLENPTIQGFPKAADLFTVTEDMDTEEAITVWIEQGLPSN